MTKPRMPNGFGAGGKLLWRGLVAEGMGEHHVALLTEACRARDRLDQLDKLLRGHASIWTHIDCDWNGQPVTLRIDGALEKANSTAGVLKNLLEKIPAPAAAPAKGGTSGTNSNPPTPLERVRAQRAQREAGGKSTRTRTAERRRPKSK